jgi:hypothetical protein
MEDVSRKLLHRLWSEWPTSGSHSFTWIEIFVYSFIWLFSEASSSSWSRYLPNLYFSIILSDTLVVNETFERIWVCRGQFKGSMSILKLEWRDWGYRIWQRRLEPATWRILSKISNHYIEIRDTNITRYSEEQHHLSTWDLNPRNVGCDYVTVAAQFSLVDRGLWFESLSVRTAQSPHLNLLRYIVLQYFLWLPGMLLSGQ